MLDKRERAIVNLKLRQIALFYANGVKLEKIEEILNLKEGYLKNGGTKLLKASGLIQDKDIVRRRSLVTARVLTKKGQVINKKFTPIVKFLFDYCSIPAEVIAQAYNIPVELVNSTVGFDLVDLFKYRSLTGYAYWIIAASLNIYSIEDWVDTFGGCYIDGKDLEVFEAYFETLSKEEIATIKDFKIVFAITELMSLEKYTCVYELYNYVARVHKDGACYTKPSDRYDVDYSKIYSTVLAVAAHRGVSCAQLAEACGMRRKEFMGFMNKKFTIDVLVTVCNYLGISLTKLLGINCNLSNL